MNIQKSDLSRIGYQAFNQDGFLVLTCYPKTSNIEYILLRGILEQFGYEILGQGDFIWSIDGDPKEHVDINLFTSMPWDEYQAFSERNQS